MAAARAARQRAREPRWVTQRRLPQREEGEVVCACKRHTRERAYRQ
jgi:hypothetical protein